MFCLNVLNTFQKVLAQAQVLALWRYLVGLSLEYFVLFHYKY